MITSAVANGCESAGWREEEYTSPIKADGWHMKKMTHAKYGEVLVAAVVCLQANEFGYWDVVKKTFPTIKENTVKFSVSTEIMGIALDQKTAEMAARKISELKDIPYVSYNSSIVTVVGVVGPFHLPVIFSPDGQFGILNYKSDKDIGAIYISDMESKRNNLIFISP